MDTRNFLIISQLHRTSVTQLHRAFWHELFCVIGRLHKVLSVNAPMTRINCLGINFPIARTSVTQKKLFPNYLCNHFGPHSTRVWRRNSKCPLPGFSPSFCSSEGSRTISKPAPNPGTHETQVETLSESRSKF